MPTKLKNPFLSTVYHTACGLGVVFVICGLLNLWSCLVVGLIGSVLLIAFLFGAAALYALVQITYERLSSKKS